MIAMYAKDIEGLLYAVGENTALERDDNWEFENIDILSYIGLLNEDGEVVLVKGVLNGSTKFHAFLLENRIVRVIKVGNY